MMYRIGVGVGDALGADPRLDSAVPGPLASSLKPSLPPPVRPARARSPPHQHLVGAKSPHHQHFLFNLE